MVTRVKSVDEAYDILKDYAPTLSKKIISLDDESRVDIYGDIYLDKLFGYSYHAALPLEFGQVSGNFYAPGLGLQTLQGSPYWVGRDFEVTNNKLKTLEGGPKHVGRSYGAYDNPLENLDGLAEHIGDAIGIPYSHNLPLLRSLVAKQIWISPQIMQVEKILNKYAGRGREGAFDCRRELRAAGFEGNARW